MKILKQNEPFADCLRETKFDTSLTKTKRMCPFDCGKFMNFSIGPAVKYGFQGTYYCGFCNHQITLFSDYLDAESKRNRKVWAWTPTAFANECQIEDFLGVKHLGPTVQFTNGFFYYFLTKDKNGTPHYFFSHHPLKASSASRSMHKSDPNASATL